MSVELNDTSVADAYSKSNFSSSTSTENSSNNVPDFIYNKNNDIAISLRAASKLMENIVPPALLVLGTFGNILIMLLFGKKKSASSLIVFFRALAVSDLCLLYTGLFPEWIQSVSGFSLRNAHDVLCKLITTFYYIFGVLSAWLVVAMTAQRAASVIWPHKVSILFTKNKSLVYILVIFVLICGINSHFLIGARLSSDMNGTESYCAGDFELDSYGVFVMKIWPFIDALVFSLVPFAILIVSNVVLIFKVSESVRKARVTFASGQSDQLNSRTKKVSSMTVTLIAVSVTFFLLSTPLSLYFIIAPYTPAQSELSPVVKEIRSFSFLFLNLLWYSNSAVNFYLYCLTGSKFKKEAKELLCHVRKDTVNTSLNTKMSKAGVSENEDETEF